MHLVFKTTCIDSRKALQDATFFFTGIAFSPLLDQDVCYIVNDQYL